MARPVRFALRSMTLLRCSLYLGHGKQIINATLAMNIGGRRDLLRLRRKHLERFAQRMGLDEESVILRFHTLVDRLPEAFDSTRQPASRRYREHWCAGIHR